VPLAPPFAIGTADAAVDPTGEDGVAVVGMEAEPAAAPARAVGTFATTGAAVGPRPTWSTTSTVNAMSTGMA